MKTFALTDGGTCISVATRMLMLLEMGLQNSVYICCLRKLLIYTNRIIPKKTLTQTGFELVHLQNKLESRRYNVTNLRDYLFVTTC